MWTYKENDAYSVGNELYHFGVKGMKWKNHRYAREIYDRINKNLVSLYDPQEQNTQETTPQQSNKATTAKKPQSVNQKKSFGKKAIEKLLSGGGSEKGSGKSSGKSSGKGGGGKGKGSGGGKGKKKGSKKKKKSSGKKEYKDISNPKTLFITDKDLVLTKDSKSKTEQTISGNISAKPKRAPIKRKNIGRAFVSKILNRRK